MSTTGERAVARYIKHPPAGSALPFVKGDSLDAGTVMALDSNIAQMQLESCRHLVWSLGPGGVTALDYTNRAQFDGLGDLHSTYDASQAPTASTISMIPWDRRTCRRFGPFFAVCDADASGGGTLRKVTMEMGLTLDAACVSSHFFFALSANEDPNELVGGHSLAFAHTSLGAGVSGQYFASPSGMNQTSAGSLTCTVIVSEDMYQLEMSRGDPTYGPGQVQVFPFYLWFGYLFQNGTNYVDSFDAFETR